MSVPQSNSTLTMEKPVTDEERTRRTWVAPFNAVSIGNDTERSTSSGAMPPASVITMTVGAFRSGNTSTSVCIAVYVPQIISSTPQTKTSRRLCRE
ncbi:hypothetical protein Barb4_04818 [Bacteroidales bacterium Barb4]|nr:hypothetical protein Barb4_04818 [Bacteroidales bacterium Barb4]